MSLPSLRTETMSDALAEKIARIRKTGFTLAPEAATERMRAVINKGNREEDLLRAVRVGLPERLVAPQALLHDRPARGARRGRGGHRRAGEALPRRGAPGAAEGAGLGGHPPRRVHLRAQAVHALPVGADDHAGGDPPAPGARHRRAGRPQRRHPVQAARLARSRPSRARSRSATGASAPRCSPPTARGQRLDGWTEWFDEGRWIAAFAEMRAGPRRRARLVRPPPPPPRRGPPLGPDRLRRRRRPYLQKQLAAARNLAEVAGLRARARARVCGACDYDVVKNRIYEAEDYVPEPPPPPRAAGAAGPDPRPGPLREAGAARRPLAPRDRCTPLLRSVRRAGLPVAFSQGYPPEAAGLLRAGAAGRGREPCEHLDLELVGLGTTRRRWRSGSAGELPEGLTRPRRAEIVDPGALSISESVRAVHYRVEFPQGLERGGALPEGRGLSCGGPVGRTRTAPPKTREKKTKPEGRGTEAKGDRFEGDRDPPAVEGPGRVAFSLKADPSGSAKPAEVLAAIFGDGAPPRGVKVLKEGVSFARTANGRPRLPAARTSLRSTPETKRTRPAEVAHDAAAGREENAKL